MPHGGKNDQHCQKVQLPRSVLNAASVVGLNEKKVLAAKTELQSLESCPGAGQTKSFLRHSAKLVFFSRSFSTSRDCVKLGFPQFRVELRFLLLFYSSSNDCSASRFKQGLVQFVEPLTRSGPTRSFSGERRTASSPTTAGGFMLLIPRSDDSCGFVATHTARHFGDLLLHVSMFF